MTDTWNTHAPEPPDRPTRRHETFPEDGPEIDIRPSRKQVIRQETYNRALQEAYRLTLNQILRLSGPFRDPPHYANPSDVLHTLQVWIRNQINDLEQI